MNPEKRFKIVSIIVLIATAIFLLSQMFCDFVISAILPQLKESLGVSSSAVALMFSSSYIPAIIFAFFGGVFVQKIGLRVLILFASMSMLVGMLTFALSSTFLGKTIGRLFFGLGTNWYLVDLVVVRWFNSHTAIPTEIAMSVTVATGMTGPVLSFNLIPILQSSLREHFSQEMTLQMTLLFLSILPAIAVLMNVIYIILDISYIDRLEHPDLSSASSKSTSLLDNVDEEGIDPSLVINLNNFPEETTPGLFSNFFMLTKSYWLLLLTMACVYSQGYLTVLFIVDFVHEKWGISQSLGDSFSSTINFTGLLTALSLGWIIRNKGHALTALFLGSVEVSLACFLLAATNLHPVVAMILLGMGLSSLELCIWTSTAVVTPEAAHGPAYSLLSIVACFNALIVPYVSGTIHDHFNSYAPWAFIVGSISMVGCVCAVLLYIKNPELQNPRNK